MKVEIIDVGNEKGSVMVVDATHEDVWYIQITLENGQVFRVSDDPEGLEVANDRKVYLQQPGSNVVLVIPAKAKQETR